MAAALAARRRAPGGISRADRDGAVKLLAQHIKNEYRLVVAHPPIFTEAVRLTQAYRLRGYDAVQLATGLAALRSLLAAGLPALIFVAADNDLIMAAQAEGLAAENPNNHP